MSKFFTAADLDDLLLHLQQKQKKQFNLLQKHELAGNHALAYLAAWALLEDFAKRIGSFGQKLRLKSEMLDWIAYLDGKASDRPKDIAANKFQLAKSMTGVIPSDELMKLVIAHKDAPHFYELMDSAQKFRIRRNTIAHSGDDVSMAIYQDFKSKAVIAVNEIEAWLMTAIKSTKANQRGKN